MKIKLLHKTLLFYSSFAILALIGSSILLYFMLQALHQEEIDEMLLSRQEACITKRIPEVKESEIALWNRFKLKQKLKPGKLNGEGHHFTTSSIFDPILDETASHRTIESNVLIEGKNYILTTSMNLIESEDLLANISFTFSLLIVLMLAGLILLTWFISRIVWKPFYAILGEIRSFEIDKGKPIMTRPTSTKEFGMLQDSLEKLSENNRGIYLRQREFVENAAHELQTPLAIFQNQMLLLMQSPGLTEEQADSLQKLEHTLKRMVRLNKNLLFLSRLDNSRFPTGELHISTLVSQQLQLIEFQFESKNLKLELNITPDVQVRGNYLLSESLVDNLLSNAVRHSAEGGKVSVELTENYLKVCNSTKSGELRKDHLFERFEKDPSNIEGHGLGLHICKKICELHAWQITYNFEGQNHCFRISF